MSFDPPLTIHRAQFSASSRPRGGQPGNDNALKHGFYSRQFTRADLPGLDGIQMGYMRDEVILLRVILRRVLAYSTEVTDLPTALTLLRGVAFASHVISRLMRAQHYVDDKAPDPSLDIAEAIHEAAEAIRREKGLDKVERIEFHYQDEDDPGESDSYTPFTILSSPPEG